MTGWRYVAQVFLRRWAKASAGRNAGVADLEVCSTWSRHSCRQRRHSCRRTFSCSATFLSPLLLLLFLPGGAAAAPPLGDLLRRTGKAIEEFSDQFGAVNCVETVSQLKLGKGDKVVYKQEAAFDYLIVMQFGGSDLSVEESRVPIKAETKKENYPLLVTNGFSTLLLIFHPQFQGGFEYSQPEPEVVDGRNLLRVNFQQAHHGRSPSVLRLRNRDYPIEWQGSAWIDPETAAVVRISTGLKNNMEDVGLKALTADVRYTPTRFREEPAVHWLPTVATVEAETPRQHWRNIHRFSDYKHFSVDTKSETQAPQQK